MPNNAFPIKIVTLADIGKSILGFIIGLIAGFIGLQLSDLYLVSIKFDTDNINIHMLVYGGVAAFLVAIAFIIAKLSYIPIRASMISGAILIILFGMIASGIVSGI
jgi:hypothetical protein